MTPEENDLVAELFDRLAKLENAPRDPGAERLIADGLRRAPHAVYALVQTALIQDEALKRANERIDELQARAAGAGAPKPPPTSFLDSMREAFGGAPRGSVPSVRPAAGYQPQSAPAQGYEPQGGYPPPSPPGYAGQASGAGGSFLGTAASTAAGVIGGALLLDGIRAMFGHHPGDHGQSALGTFASDKASPWGGGTSGSAADSTLARDAGIDHVGDHAKDGAGTDQADADDGSYQVADAADEGMDDDGFGDDGFSDGGSYDA